MTPNEQAVSMYNQRILREQAWREEVLKERTAPDIRVMKPERSYTTERRYARDGIDIGAVTSKTYLFMKRFLDIVFSLIALVILSPIFAIIAIAIKIDSEGSVFYKQERVGENGKSFMLYKFRSMVTDAESQLDKLKALNERDGPVFKISGDPRVTRVGKFIRKTCLDEIPQFWNTLTGSMSIVGPRPPLVTEVEQYAKWHKQRLAVKPGITCLWQVKREEAETFDEWMRMDIRYIRSRNIGLDIKLMLMTAGVILRHKGDE
jgi:lipopolysaccharide/colanic/teichoic acid biosynthesis glycosyltransferase